VAVILQTKDGEKSIPRKDVQRIQYRRNSDERKAFETKLEHGHMYLTNKEAPKPAAVAQPGAEGEPGEMLPGQPKGPAKAPGARPAPPAKQPKAPPAPKPDKADKADKQDKQDKADQRRGRDRGRTGRDRQGDARGGDRGGARGDALQRMMDAFKDNPDALKQLQNARNLGKDIPADLRKQLEKLLDPEAGADE
jgi:hypothetical protein